MSDTKMMRAAFDLMLKLLAEASMLCRECQETKVQQDDADSYCQRHLGIKRNVVSFGLIISLRETADEISV